MSLEMAVVITPGGRGFTTNTTQIWFLSTVHFHVIGQVVAARKCLVALRTTVRSKKIQYKNMKLNTKRKTIKLVSEMNIIKMK